MSTYPDFPILIVDDEEEILESETMALNMGGINNIMTCSDSRKVISILNEHPCIIVVLDITMPHVDGLVLLEEILHNFPEITVIMLSGMNRVETAVDCLKMGAYDYIVKPIDQKRLVTCIEKAIEHRKMYDETQRLRKSILDNTLVRPEAFAAIVTQNMAIKNICRYIDAIAPSQLPVLITGETGTGKELVAQAVHLASGAPGEFVIVNCAGIDDTMFSDTLFGHRRGAFTGAEQQREGLIKRAVNGTLYLDEIGDLRPESQVKLLRLLQEGTYYPLGSDIFELARTRFVTSTNVDLSAVIEKNLFRKDLYYRLQSHQVHLPALRERKSDIGLLVDHFLTIAAEEMNKTKPTAPPELQILLENYNFPGNIRELRGMIFDAVGQHRQGVLSCDTFKNYIQSKGTNLNRIKENPSKYSGMQFPNPLPTLKQIEEKLIAEALIRTQGNKTLAANMLGIARQTFRTKVKQLKNSYLETLLDHRT